MRKKCGMGGLWSPQTANHGTELPTPGQIIATLAEVTPNGGLVRESPQDALNLGILVIM